MACLVPRMIVNPRYRKIAPDRHYFLYNDIDGLYPKKDYYIQIPCNRCVNCFKKYMSQWRTRLLYELLYYSRAQISRTYFVTLTLEPKHYTEKKPLLKKYIRQFLEHVRYKTTRSPRHFIVTERGEDKNRLHFHAIFFDCNFPKSHLHKFWKFGFVKARDLVCPDYTISQSVSYITTYITKGKKGKIENIISPENFPLVLVSPGLGLNYVKRNHKFHHQGTLIPFCKDVYGNIVSLPRYYRQKVFSEDELKSLKDTYFDNFSHDVMPEPPYFIGGVQYDDYSVYLSKLVDIKNEYNLIYGK